MLLRVAQRTVADPLFYPREKRNGYLDPRLRCAISLEFQVGHGHSSQRTTRYAL